MNALLQPLSQSEGFLKLNSELENAPACALLASGVVDSQKWHLAAGLIQKQNRPALIVAPSELKAKEIYEDLYYFFRDNCRVYPSRDMIFYAADVKSVDITRQRLRVLDLLQNTALSPRPAHKADFLPVPVIILSSEALLDRMIPPDVFAAHRISFAAGDTYQPGALAYQLGQMGYERCSLAEGPGQYAVRGGIMDIYPAVAHYEIDNENSNILTENQALRLEFFGDEIESIRVMDAFSQRSTEKAGRCVIYPVKELVFSKKRLQSAIDRIEAEFEKQRTELRKRNLRTEAQALSDMIGESLEKLREETTGVNADAFFPYFYEEENNLLDYMPLDTLVFFDEPNHISVHMETALAEFNESSSHRLLSGRLLPSQMKLILDWQQVLYKANAFHRILFMSMTAVPREFPSLRLRVSFSVRACMPLRHRPQDLKEDLSYWLKQGFRVVILAGPRRHGQTLTDSINGLEIPVRYLDSLEEAELTPGVVIITRGTMVSGFEYPECKLAVVTDKELFATDRKRRRRNRKNKDAEKIGHISDLRIGDYIVHENHGIGVFKGIEQVVTEGMSRDYLKLEYADGGHLYVQTAQMDMIQKYIGGAVKAKLNKLGGADWTKAKARARKAVEILASDLIALYARRQAATAFVYGEDSIWQSEFESQFPYEETEDQVSAIEDVKKDMESSRVMDRLICGDVGYGKTEIAIRAAFKAVQDNKQVAYLVPTTILAQQHYQTFAARMKDYPMTVERLSRFQTKKEQQITLQNLEKGSSDIVVGTHRLLSKDVKFKDLGLIIIDEEQRFGVSHKEKLKALKSNVDVLTLTATPIPRTLHLSLTGIRDMSLLNEPPEERRPVQTYVMEYNAEFVRDAINREIARNGQVYYLHNRVRNITEEAARVQALVPLARVAFAHGQMSEHELENIMQEFVEGHVQVLVCTTIVETGLDIPNVNTIIIQDADFMGLSQLYQLRGRVGRSNRLAYAYLMYRRDKVLQEEAEKRLQTIREFTEFGSGFKIAMRDLEIRGAGNLLGAEQHGHLDSVGYDMYCKLLSEAVNELKGEIPKEAFETSIEINVNAYIPDYFIPDEQQKLEMYKKISLIRGQADVADVREELEDRFGEIPKPAGNLLDVAILKAIAHSLGVISVSQKQGNIVITFRGDAGVDVDKLAAVITREPSRLLLTMAPNPYLTIRQFNENKKLSGQINEDDGGEQVKQARDLLEKLR